MHGANPGSQRCFLSAGMVSLVIMALGISLYQFALIPNVFPNMSSLMGSKSSAADYLMVAGVGLLAAVTIMLFVVWPANSTLNGYMSGAVLGVMLAGIVGLTMMYNGTPNYGAKNLITDVAFWALVFAAVGGLASYASYNWILIKRS